MIAGKQSGGEQERSRLKSLVDEAPVVLMEGAVTERLRRRPDFDPHIMLAALLYQDEGRRSLGDIYRQYLDIGREVDLPLMLDTPTARANPERIKASGYRDRPVNADAVAFMKGIRDEYGEYGQKVMVGGLICSRGDMYKPEEALSAGRAAEFHREQAYALAGAGVDFLHAATLSALSEALGLAGVLAETGLPYIISYVVRPEGELLDGAMLAEAVRIIDSEAHPKPWMHMINCVHPVVVAAAALSRQADPLRGKISGIQANTSSKSRKTWKGRARSRKRTRTFWRRR